MAFFSSLSFAENKEQAPADKEFFEVYIKTKGKAYPLASMMTPTKAVCDLYGDLNLCTKSNLLYIYFNSAQQAIAGAPILANQGVRQMSKILDILEDDMDGQDVWGNTLLHMAARTGNKKIVQKIIDNGFSRFLDRNNFNASILKEVIGQYKMSWFSHEYVEIVKIIVSRMEELNLEIDSEDLKLIKTNMPLANL